jgi:rSAM/selenodomain-associated transferase 1
LTPTNNRKALIIFIRNPELGKVKTRLAKDLGDEQALSIYKALLQHTKEQVLQINATRFLFYSESIAHHDTWNHSQFQKQLQYNGDLGERMHHAFLSALQQADQVIIVGSDIAQLKASIIDDAFQVLQHHDYVIGPALDGGYYLLGMKQASPELFLNMEWSTDQLCQNTIDRINQLNRSYQLVDTLSDIDYASDWEAYGWPIPIKHDDL